MGTSHREAKYIINHIDKTHDYIIDEIDAHKRVTSATKQNHLEMKRKLLECLELVDELLEQDNVVFDETPAEDSCDLDDILIPEVLPSLNKPTPTLDESRPKDKYTPKFIIHNYARRLEVAVEDDYESSVASNFVVLLDSWFKQRFLPSIPDPTFHYTASRITEWVDILILSYGKAVHDDRDADFRADFRGWLSDLQTRTDKWPVPSSVRNVVDSGRTADYTQEAVLIEKLVKPHIYDSEFYSTKMNSVANIVIEHNQDVELLDINKMADNCPNIRLRR